MNQSKPLPDELDAAKRDPSFEQQVERLYQLTVYGRWLVVGILWLTVGIWSLWSLRSEFELWQQYFTWAAVRYAIAYNRVPAFGLSLCIGLAIAVLIWQTRHLLFGRSTKEQQQLQQTVLRIRRQGPSHPLWKWVCSSPAKLS